MAQQLPGILIRRNVLSLDGISMKTRSEQKTTFLVSWWHPSSPFTWVIYLYPNKITYIPTKIHQDSKQDHWEDFFKKEIAFKLKPKSPSVLCICNGSVAAFWCRPTVQVPFGSSVGHGTNPAALRSPHVWDRRPSTYLLATFLSPGFHSTITQFFWKSKKRSQKSRQKIGGLPQCSPFVTMNANWDDIPELFGCKPTVDCMIWLGVAKPFPESV